MINFFNPKPRKNPLIVDYGYCWDWLKKHEYILDRYLLERYTPESREAKKLLFLSSPLEAFWVLQDFNMSNKEKYQRLIEFISFTFPCFVGIAGNQRQGKGSLKARIIEDVLKLKYHKIYSIMTFKKYPMQNDDDIYYSLTKVPPGTAEKPCIVIIEEGDMVFPARGFNSEANNELNILINTMAQNYQKLIIEMKSPSNVDIVFFKNVDIMVYKYIDRHKLQIKSGKTDSSRNLLSPIGMELLPRNFDDKSSFLVHMKDRYYTCTYEMPEWYNDDLAHGYNNIHEDQVKDLAWYYYNNKLKLRDVAQIVNIQCRKNYEIEWYKNLLENNSSS